MDYVNQERGIKKGGKKSLPTFSNKLKSKLED